MGMGERKRVRLREITSGQLVLFIKKVAHERKDRCDRPRVERLFIGEKRMGKEERGDWPLGSGVAEEERRERGRRKEGGRRGEREMGGGQGPFKGAAVNVHRRCF